MLKKAQHTLTDLFAPSARNSYIPYALSRAAFLFLAASGVLLVLSPLYFPRSPLASLANFVIPFRNEDVIKLINASRRELALGELAENTALTDAAATKAADMFAHQYFSHTSPDNKEPWAFLKEQGYEYAAAGENLAIDFMDAREAHTALMNSPSHRANILNARYREVGIAVESGVFRGRPSIIIVQFFGAPEKTPAPVVENDALPPLPRLTKSEVLDAATDTGISKQHIITFSQFADTIKDAFTSHLSRGSRGTEVEKLQTLLAGDPNLYPEQAITGYYGTLTENAIKRFQIRHGIVAHGTPETTGFGALGPKTRIKLAEVFGQEGKRFAVLGDTVSAEMRAHALAVRLPWSEIVKIIASLAMVCLIIPMVLLMARRYKLPLETAARTIFLIACFLYISWVAASSESMASRVTEVSATTTTARLK